MKQPSQTGAQRKQADQTLLAALILAVATLALYLPVGGFSFLLYDDSSVLTANMHLRAGLTWSSVRWAFTTTYLGNWVPVTWLSHLADVSLFGMRPGPQHLVNAAVHTVNVILLLLFLHRATGALGRSVAVAALFAFHPLHVESVAWVTLRRDVLMGLFGLLSLLAWERYVHRRSARWYLLSLLAFSFGLAAKPLLMTLPLLLLLLDWWPFGRYTGGAGELTLPGAQAAAIRLLLEKTPFLLLSLVVGVVSLRAQQTVINPIPFAYRAMNAAVSVVWYLGKSLWPTKLAIFYPHPGLGQSRAEAFLAAILLVIVTAVVLRYGRRLPWLVGGWLWFFVGLLPTLGLLAQVGEQARADRYTYLPLIGLSWSVVWGGVALVARSDNVRRRLPAAAILALALYAAVAATQLRHWKDDFTVFEHALEVTRNNHVAEANLGCAWDNAGRPDLAERHLREALRIFPNNPAPHNNLGVIAMRDGRLAAAEQEFRAALAIGRRNGYIYRNLGLVLSWQGRTEEALPELKKALEIDPEDIYALEEMALLLARAGARTAAVDLLRRATAIAADDAALRFNLGMVLTESDRLPEGEVELREAALLDPANAAAANNLGLNLARQGRIGEAQIWFSRAVELNPGDENARSNLGRARNLNVRGGPGDSFGNTTLPMAR